MHKVKIEEVRVIHIYQSLLVGSKRLFSNKLRDHNLDELTRIFTEIPVYVHDVSPGKPLPDYAILARFSRELEMDLDSEYSHEEVCICCFAEDLNSSMEGLLMSVLRCIEWKKWARPYLLD